MKPWWGNFVKDYLTFTKKERNGIFIILIFSALIWFISRYYPVNKKRVNSQAFQKELAELKISIDTSRNAYAYQHEDNAEYLRPNYYRRPTEGELFAFDPNTLDARGWKRLGVRDKTIKTIRNFLAKGYRFNKPDDIRKIYGLHEQEADRLVPYVRLAEKETLAKVVSESHHTSALTKSYVAIDRIKIIDINAADTAELISLPGIGSKLASRIINFRQKLGGFSSIGQLAETYGVPDSTFQNIKGRLQCSISTVRKINVNTANASELKAHPYIKWNIANAIINYRAQHGAYKSLQDLLKIEIINQELLDKLAPYFVL